MDLNEAQRQFEDDAAHIRRQRRILRRVTNVTVEILHKALH